MEKETGLIVLPPPLTASELAIAAIERMRATAEVALTPKKMRGIVADWSERVPVLPWLVAATCVTFAGYVLRDLFRASVAAVMGR